MEQIYEKARLSSDSSIDVGLSEEVGFISKTITTVTKHECCNRVSRHLRSMSIRAIMETFMGIVIFVLVVVLASNRSESKAPTFGPWLPEKLVKFGNTAHIGPDLVYVDHEMLYNATHKRELHENWQALYPKGRGYIKATRMPEDNFDYANPAYVLDDFPKPGDHYEGYILSVFHQLHCLSILTSRLGTSYEEFATFTRPQLEHTSHCIEYLRQAILCNGDTALEGETGAWPASAAWGQMHTCKDYDALIALANERAMWDLSNARHVDLSKIHPDPAETKGKYGGD